MLAVLRLLPTDKIVRLPVLFAASLLLALAACDSVSAPEIDSPFAGLTNAAVADSVGNLPPSAPATATPGYFRGTVLGPSAPGAGNDSLATAPRVVGARIAAFPVVSGTVSNPVLGAEAAAATTDAAGRFTLPTLPGGEYVVTITPLESGPYGGVWVRATAHAGSHEHPWWIVLWAK